MASKLGECCEGMKLVLGRTRDSDRLGLMIETFFSLRGGGTRETLVIRFHKNKDRKAKMADTTSCALNYCPFCAAKTKEVTLDDESGEVPRG